MASLAGGRRRAGQQSWLSALLGVALLVSGGFLLGLIVGVVSEEPELVVGHLAGRSSEIAWASEAARESGPGGGRAVAVSGGGVPGRSRPDGAAASGEGALPSVAAPPPSAAGPAYAIQVGAFGESGAAGLVATRLREKGYRVHVVSPRGDDRWRVRVGPVAGRGEAERMARRLKIEERLPTWVLPQPSS